MPAQTNSNQECLTQEDCRGVDVLNIPESCNVTQTDIKHDNVMICY